jgi:hypothetical protein
VINAGDILRLDFTPDLTQGGISYACYSLPQLYTKAGYAARNVLRQTVAQVAVELALRRHLVEKRIPFEVRGAVPFTAPNHFDVMLRGQRCDIRTFLITNRNQIHSIQMDPGLILEAPALVPVDQYAAEGQSNQDLYLFAFALGTNADSPADGGRSRESEGRMHLLHVMPGSWAHPRAWIPLGPLVLKSEDLEALALEIGGQDRDRGNLARSVVLPPRTRLEVADDFHSVTYLHVGARPTGRLGIRSPSRKETQVADPTEWRNIWINGTDIYVAGWITREQFRQRAILLHEGSRVFQYSRTRTRNLAVPVSELKPLTQLLERARMKAE